ncbi:GAF domain-containing protein [Actinoplanes sp. URMC 104]|uniref:GAF domain-containing protein n=1 Tax=Actinoplanes sp. URMC 104 TaxID=3423409 RepID=UPI003F19A851
MPVDQLALSLTLQSLLRVVDLPAATDGAALIGHLNRVLDATQDVLQIDGAGLLLRDGNNGLRMVGASDAAGAALEQGQLEVDQGPAIDCVATGAVVAVTDLAESDYADLWAWLEARNADGNGPGVRAVLSAPVRVAGDVVGTLNALRSRSGRWSADEVRAVEAYGGLIGVLLRLQAGTADEMIRAGRPPEHS